MSLLKNNENEKKKLFEWSNEIEQTFSQFENIFMLISFLTHYDLLKRNQVKTDASNFIVMGILNQQDEMIIDARWRSDRAR